MKSSSLENIGSVAVRSDGAKCQVRGIGEPLRFPPTGARRSPGERVKRLQPVWGGVRESATSSVTLPPLLPPQFPRPRSAPQGRRWEPFKAQVGPWSAELRSLRTFHGRQRDTASCAALSRGYKPELDLSQWTHALPRTYTSTRTYTHTHACVSLVVLPPCAPAARIRVGYTVGTLLPDLQHGARCPARHPADQDSELRKAGVGREAGRMCQT